MKIQDGIYPVYVKDGVIYPVGLTQKQLNILPIAMKILAADERLRVMKDHPIGKAVNLVVKGEKTDDL